MPEPHDAQRNGISSPRINALLKRIESGPIRQQWHWLGYNFTRYTEGWHYFGLLTATALGAVDTAMPGYAEMMIKRLEGMGGREKDQRDFESIKEWLAELVVVLHLVNHEWPSPPIFTSEPRAKGSTKNPELLVDVSDIGRLGVEVKCPDLASLLAKNRVTNSLQLLDRFDRDLARRAGITLPADNKVKDCLVSADAKFAAFRANDPDFRSVLVIVWDDYINEPVSALASPSSGLLTASTYYRTAQGVPVTFPNVDGVLLVRHQHQLIRGTQNKPPLDDRRHFLDFGKSVESFPPHALIRNPAGRVMDKRWIEALHASPLESLSLAAEYRPAEIVIWN